MIRRKADIYINNLKAGELKESSNGFTFTYVSSYLRLANAVPISLTFPLRPESYKSTHLFPFFCGLLAEGINKETQCRILKIDEQDLFGLLIRTAQKDTIGAITVKANTRTS